MAQSRIFVLCPDYAPPSGGVRRLYRHVDVLHRHGRPAFILHAREGFRCTWFDNATPVVYRGTTAVGPDDVLVVPEICGPDLGTLASGVRKVVFNQNAYLTFGGYTLDPVDLRTPYTRSDVVAAFTVSEDNRAYLAYAFPRLRLFRLHYGIDGRLFAPRPKRPLIGYMPRKNANDVVQVINLLKHRGALAGFQFAAIDGWPEAEVAALLGECSLFFSFGYPEGCPLPPLEAMASGCVVVGYHGRGGREYFRDDFCYPVEAGDVVGFARAAEAALALQRTEPEVFAAKAERAAAFVRQHYSPEQEEADILHCWQTILAG